MTDADVKWWINAIMIASLIISGIFYFTCKGACL
jgi:hypothetical protein